MAASQNVSFTVRRPTPTSRAASSGPDSDNPSFKIPSLPRHLAQSTESIPLSSPLARNEADSPHTNGYYDSSDEGDEIQDELVTGFDRFGVQRLHGDQNKKKNREPLVIPALKNKDWRELARKRRSAQQYIPLSAKAQAGTDGSVGGLGTQDVIGSGTALSGLQVHKKAVKVEVQDDAMTQTEVVANDIKMEETELAEDELARRAILAEANGIKSERFIIDAIPTPVSEGEAYKQDVEELPDVASLEDYARVPVDQFGAAMLRGMGWKEGTAASRNSKGLAQPYLPAARPALLGIGAKEMEVFDDGSKKKGPVRPEKKYVPVIKRERQREDTPGSGRDRSRSPLRSRRSSPATDGDKVHGSRPKDDGYDRRRDCDRDKDRNRVRDGERDREGERERKKKKDKSWDRERDHNHYGQTVDRREKDRRGDHDKDRSDRGDRSRDSSRKRNY